MNREYNVLDLILNVLLIIALCVCGGIFDALYNVVAGDYINKPFAFLGMSCMLVVSLAATDYWMELSKWKS